MDRDAFEQLVSAWLDEPERTDLQRQVEEAVRLEPELAALLAEWRRFDEVFRSQAPELRGVDWAKLEGHISAAIDAADTSTTDEDALDTALHDLPSIEPRVDWPRLHERIAAAVRRSDQGVLRRRWRVILGTATVAGLAAAAALVLTILPNPSPALLSSGVVRVTVGVPAAAVETSTGVAYARVSVTEAVHEQPQRFFSIDPIQQPAASDDAGGFY
jgi:hypothetical protein